MLNRVSPAATVWVRFSVTTGAISTFSSTRGGGGASVSVREDQTDPSAA